MVGRSSPLKQVRALQAVVNKSHSPPKNSIVKFLHDNVGRSRMLGKMEIDTRSFVQSVLVECKEKVARKIVNWPAGNLRLKKGNGLPGE